MRYRRHPMWRSFYFILCFALACGSSGRSRTGGTAGTQNSNKGAAVEAQWFSIKESKPRFLGADCSIETVHERFLGKDFPLDQIELLSDDPATSQDWIQNDEQRSGRISEGWMVLSLAKGSAGLQRLPKKFDMIPPPTPITFGADGSFKTTGGSSQNTTTQIEGQAQQQSLRGMIRTKSDSTFDCAMLVVFEGVRTNQHP